MTTPRHEDPCDVCGSASAETITVCRSCAGDVFDRLAEARPPDLTPPGKLPPWLTVADTAAYLGVTDETVRDLIKKRRLVAVDLAQSTSRNGHRWRIPRKSIRKLLATTLPD